MYIQECLAREKQAQRLSRAREERTAQRLAELTRLGKRVARAERALLRTRQRAGELRGALEPLS